MRAVVQRVSDANVVVEDAISGKIKGGLVVLLGVEEGDKQEDLNYIFEKVIHLRIFDDQDGKMNFSLMDIGGELLVVSQFTLLGDCRKGRRPSFVKAAQPEMAKVLYEGFVDQAKEKNIFVQTGVFQADMKLNLTNDGPVTIVVDSKKNF